MRVSIINVNLEGYDAIGQAIVNQVRFFQRRGDEVQIYLAHPPHNVLEAAKSLARVVSLADLNDRMNVHFAASDLFVYHYPSRYPLLESIRSLERGVVVFYYHNVTPPSLWGSSVGREVLQDSVVAAGAFANYADLLVTDSTFNADQLVEDYGIDRDRIRVLPLPVALDRFHPGPKEPDLLKRYNLHGRRVILFVGRMAGNKRIDLLVEALAQVRQRVPNAILMLVGDDRGNAAIEENVARARSRAAELAVADAVAFTARVDNLPDYYRLADVYATASLHEGFGVPLIEAMASGVPVVASRATAHPWVLGEAGLLTEPGNVAELADALARVLTDDALCGELVQRGLARAQEFSLERYEAGWGRVVAEASNWLPNQPYPRLRAAQVQLTAPPTPEPAPVSISNASIDELKAAADVMLRGYVVHSAMPVLGSLVAWIRRNLTSHLREPYLDPTIERQVEFNRRMVHTVRTLAARLAQYEGAQSDSQARMAHIEAQVDLLSAQLARLELGASGTVSADQIDAADRGVD